jgi:hypothetical protein
MADHDTTLTNGSLDALSQGQEEEPMGIKEGDAASDLGGPGHL